MKLIKALILTAGVLGAGLGPTPSADAQMPAAAPANAQIGNYRAALQDAFQPGYWQGHFEERDAAGKVVDQNDTPSCIRANDREDFAAAISKLIDIMQSVGTCTVIGGRPGSLDLTMSCRPTGNKDDMLMLVSQGKYVSGQTTELTIAMGSPTGKPPMSAMHVEMRKASDTCPG